MGRSRGSAGTSETPELPDAAPDFDVAGHVRRARRIADLSQRDLAERLGMSRAAVARLETASCRPDIATLEAILELAGLRLAVVEVATGTEVAAVPQDTLRDHAGRRFPSHLDVTGPDVAIPTDRGVDPRKGLPAARGWYRQRALRDWGRTKSGELPVDHPTVRSERVRLQAKFDERTARARIAAAAGPETECTCLDECFELACRPDCACQCEPDWGTRASVPWITQRFA